MHRDHLGSILAISNELGFLIEKRHFDPWGNIVRYYNEYTGAQTPFGDALDEAMFLDRGYTGHEHLLSVGLINMNARLYDPVVHRFLQPDAFVQDPTNTQCYNRYGYASNNPLKYSDPSGNVLPALAIAAIIGAGIGAASYTLTALLADVPFNISGLIQAVAISTISSVVTSGIGTACQAITNVANKIVVQAVAHGTFQGVMSGIQGGSFVSGFAAGCLASLASSAFGLDYNGKGKAGLGFAGKFRESGAGMIAFGTISGGAGAALTGGNFWQGAVTGLIVSGLNHAMHSGDDGNVDPPTEDEKAQAEGWKSAEFKRLYELNEFCLEAYGFVSGAAELSAVKWGGFTTVLKGLFSAEAKLVLRNSVSNVIGKSYRSVSEVTVSIKNTGLLKSLNSASKGEWVKVYEAGTLHGRQIETHYFRNNTTYKVFDVKIKYNYWHQKAFK